MAELQQADELEKSSIKKRKNIQFNPEVTTMEEKNKIAKQNNTVNINNDNDSTLHADSAITPNPKPEINKEENNIFNFFGIFSRFCKEDRDEVKTIQEKTQESITRNQIPTASPNKNFMINRRKSKYITQSLSSLSPEVNKGLNASVSNPHVPMMTLGEMPSASLNPGSLKKPQKPNPAEINKNKSPQPHAEENPQYPPPQKDSEGSNSNKSNEEDRDQVNEIGAFKLIRNDKKRISLKSMTNTANKRHSVSNNSNHESDVRSQGSSNTNGSRSKDNQSLTGRSLISTSKRSMSPSRRKSYRDGAASHNKTLKKPNQANKLLEEKEDPTNLMQVEGFPCQMLDFAELTFTIDEINRWEEQYCLAEILEINVPPDETFDSLIEGMCLQEGVMINVFLVLTTKQILIYAIVTEKTVKLFKSIDIKSLQTVLIHKREIYLIRKMGDSKVVEKFDIKIGCDVEPYNEQQYQQSQIKTTKNEQLVSAFNKLSMSTSVRNTTMLSQSNNNNNTNQPILDEDQYREKQKHTKLRDFNYQVKAFYFAISLWRVYFITCNKFLSVVKIQDIAYLDYIVWEDGYLENIFRKVLEKKHQILFDCFIKFEVKKFLINRDKLRKQGLLKHHEDVRVDEELANELIKTKKEKSGKINTIFDGVCMALYEDPGRSLEFMHQNLKYSKFVIKIFQELIIFFDIYNDTVSFIELELIDELYTNENRFLLVLYIYRNLEDKLNFRKSEREKIVLYHNTSYDPEYQFYRIFLIHLFEFKRLCKYDYDINIINAEKIWYKIKTDKLMYFSFSKNNFYVKEKTKKSGFSLAENNHLKKFDNVKNGGEKKFCCFGKKKNTSKRINEKQKFKFIQNLEEDKMDTREGCNIL